jgi:hypothetical protein
MNARRLWGIPLYFAACAPPPAASAPCPPGTASVVVATTDYTVGALAMVCDDGSVRDGLTEIGGDPAVQVDDDAVWVLDRAGGDAIRRYPLAGPFDVPLWEVGLDVPANPHEVALFGGALWVSLYDRGTLLRLDPESGAQLGEIALPDDGDGDGLAEPDALIVDGDRLWVVLQRLDRTTGWRSESGRLVAFDAGGAIVAREDVGPNPSLLRGGSGLFLRTGHWYALDGELRPWVPGQPPGAPIFEEATIGHEIAAYVQAPSGRAIRVDVGLNLGQHLRCLGPDGRSVGVIPTEDALFGLRATSDGDAWVAARTGWVSGARGAGLLHLDVDGCTILGDPYETRLEPFAVAIPGER